MLEIRDMNEKDIFRVYQLYNENFFFIWTKEQIRYDLLKNAIVKILVASVDEYIVGFYVCKFTYDVAELLNIVVDKNYRLQGIGTKLIENFILNAKNHNKKEIYLNASTKNLNSINFYKDRGFKINKIKKNFYRKINQDAYEMIRGV